MELPAPVQEFIDQERLGAIVATDSLQGGLTSVVLRLTFEAGTSLILKQSERAQPGMYVCEADGLDTLKNLPKAGAPKIPAVYSVAEDHLLIEDFGPQTERNDNFWRAFGYALAELHDVTGPAFGYHRANYLGTMLLVNDWQDDGHAYFANTRIRFFLDKPKVLEAFAPRDIDRLHKLADLLPDLIPSQGPSLLHGDLWTGNMIATPAGEPALIDPAVNFGWPEADIALLSAGEEIPPVFFDAYQERHPLQDGWKDRLEILAIRDPLCMIAEYGDIYNAVARILAVVDKVVG